MQVKVESISNVKKKINFEIPAARVATEIDRVFDAISKRTAIKGFRRGKVPKALLEKHYSDMMEQDVVKNLVNDTYFKALADEKIYPVSHPLIENDDLKKGEPFRYSAVVEVLPEVVVDDYVGLEVSKVKYHFDEEVVNRRIEELREGLAQLEPAANDRPVVNGDFVTFDFEGFIEGVPFEGGKGENYQLELGSGQFIPGFEEQMCGMKPGDAREIRVTFPENYGKEELAGKEATFAIEVKELRVKKMPPLDDDFAKEIGEFETLDQLRVHLGKEYEKQELDRIDAEFKEHLVKALIDRNDLDIPDSLIDHQLDLMLDNAKKRLAYQKISLEMMGLDDEKYKVQFRSVAESQVKGSLLLEALAKKENIGVSDDDIEEKCRQISGDNEQSKEAVKNYYAQNVKAKESLIAQIREDKAIDILVSQAKVTEVSRDQVKQ